MTAKTPAQRRQKSRNKRLAQGEKELRSLFVPETHHDEIKEAVRKYIQRYLKTKVRG